MTSFPFAKGALFFRRPFFRCCQGQELDLEDEESEPQRFERFAWCLLSEEVLDVKVLDVSCLSTLSSRFRSYQFF